MKNTKSKQNKSKHQTKQKTNKQTNGILATTLMASGMHFLFLCPYFLFSCSLADLISSVLRLSKSGSLCGCVFNVAQKMAACWSVKSPHLQISWASGFFHKSSKTAHTLIYTEPVCGCVLIDWLVWTAKMHQTVSAFSQCLSSSSASSQKNGILEQFEQSPYTWIMSVVPLHPTTDV